VEKVRVVPTGEIFPIGRWFFQRLEDTGGLGEGDPLILVPPGTAAPDERYGGGVVVAGATWALRPGELVPVNFVLDKIPTGFYVPMNAIRELNGAHSVFVVRDGAARRLPVTVHETFHDLRRIEGEGLAAGDAIVVEGAHYIGDGDAVRIVEG
jgi:multidrug efflux pump subunit AcrA (membrane-fusion protein)